MAPNGQISVAIVGSGIGGLTLSAALGFLDTDRKLDVQIYEASRCLSEVGAGINFWPRTWEIMKKIGLEQTLLKFLPSVPNESTRVVFQVRKGDQEKGIHIKDLNMKGGSIRFHRADLQQALLNCMHGELHLSHRLLQYEEAEDRVCLHFENGAHAFCDVLIGMDGIKSAVRRRFLEKSNRTQSPSYNPIWSGDVAYRGLVPTEQLESAFPGHRALTTPMIYCGKSKHVVVYPVSQDKLVNVVAFTGDPSKEGAAYEGPTTTECSQDEVLNTFIRWEPEVQALLKCIKNPTKWAIQALQPMERYSHGRVILAGDAAHGMTPHQGAGAGQAVEDAYILSNLLTNGLCTKENIRRISGAYNYVRCPAANKILNNSRTSGRLCQLMALGFEDILEGDATIPLNKLVDLIDIFYKDWDWIWRDSAEDDCKRAIQILKAREHKL